MKSLLLFLFFFFPITFQAQEEERFADKPLFRDPVFDGAADPVVIWNHAEQKWFMLYTNRKASDTTLDGVTWVHGTRIGIAESSDGGVTWQYRDTCDIQYRPDSGYTHWAPEVIYNKGLYHMYLTYVPGVFADWKHPRRIVHHTSKNLIEWQYESTLDLASEKVIDACVFQLPGGGWRMYYNNEADKKSIYYADSPDLYNWTDSCRKVVGDRGGEGPYVFQWRGKYRMIVDNWNGLGVYSSDDLVNWHRQSDVILGKSGTGPDDEGFGHHAMVVVSNDRAFLFYFTHPGRKAGASLFDQRRSSVHVAELEMEEGQVVCQRDKPVLIRLVPPEGWTE
ncbi:MAG: glycosyl hydrolase [Bacteroidales bacterium]|nr:glycosyl hydrolase [Bacteroidales bacterium]MBN2763376.1 glycosyl hydrolase [Bacteroidales bacterium]